MNIPLLFPYRVATKGTARLIILRPTVEISGAAFCVRWIDLLCNQHR
jgi:hypothetical protein